MRAYVDLQKVLPLGLYTLFIDMGEYPEATAKARAKRLGRSEQVMVTQFQKLVYRELAEKVGHGKYIATYPMDSKVNYKLD